jgi:type IV pilus assembly protein PilQ
MKKLDEAKEYFDVAVSGQRPASEALQSYAMFSEENENYLEALLLLARHEDLYGDSLDTMIARARIYEKEGNSDKAAAEYRAILLSGYQLPSDLARYIKGRLALEAAKDKSGK